jgi:hypothetical protein
MDELIEDNKSSPNELYPYSYTVNTDQLHKDEENKYHISLGEEKIPIPSMDGYISWD